MPATGRDGWRGAAGSHTHVVRSPVEPGGPKRAGQCPAGAAGVVKGAGLPDLSAGQEGWPAPRRAVAQGTSAVSDGTIEQEAQ